MEIAGKTALITGASGGIGEALARRMAEAGAGVIAFARRTDRLQALAAAHPGRIIPAGGDVTDTGALQQAVDAARTYFGRLDILVNNAGVAVVGPLATMPRELLERGYAVNVVGPVLALQAAFPLLTRPGGMVINVSSGMSLRPSPGMAVYASSKAALNSLSASMREELRQDGIHVMTVHPGFIGNDFGANSLFSQDADAASRIGTSQTRSARTSDDAARDIMAAIAADESAFLHNSRGLPPPL